MAVACALNVASVPLSLHRYYCSWKPLLGNVVLWGYHAIGAVVGGAAVGGAHLLGATGSHSLAQGATLGIVGQAGARATTGRFGDDRQPSAFGKLTRWAGKALDAETEEEVWRYVRLLGRKPRVLASYVQDLVDRYVSCDKRLKDKERKAFATQVNALQALLEDPKTAADASRQLIVLGAKWTLSYQSRRSRLEDPITGQMLSRKDTETRLRAPEEELRDR